MARLAAHNADAFTELYRRHVNRVYRYLWSRVGDVGDAQELTAETFLALVKGISSYQGQSKFVTWLLGIAQHKAVDHFRRQRQTVPLESVVGLAHPDGSPDEALTGRIDLAQVRRALGSLSADRAEAITLHVFAGLSIAEVAQVMEKSEAAVRMLIHRAARDLRERLAFMIEVEP